jgi:hypothetical protein
MGRSQTQVMGSYILRIVREGEAWRYSLQNIKTSERLEFDSMEALQGYLDRQLRLLRKSNTG